VGRKPTGSAIDQCAVLTVKNNISQHRECLVYKTDRNIREIMAIRNCSFFEANKLVNGLDDSILSNYSRYTAPKEWSPLPTTYTNVMTSHKNTSSDPSSESISCYNQQAQHNKKQQYLYSSHNKPSSKKVALNERITTLNIIINSNNVKMKFQKINMALLLTSKR